MHHARMRDDFFRFAVELVEAPLGTEAAEVAAASTEQIGVMSLILKASPMVQFVMAVLALMSVVCWFIIGAKWTFLKNAQGSSARFLDRFWEGDVAPTWSTQRLEGIYGQVDRFDNSPLASMFRSGYVELARLLGADPQAHAPSSGGDALNNVDRALRRTAGSELTRLESMLPFLATTASSAPFIGLFGTVWGIMNSFMAIADQKSVGLDVVAPGIAEALIATAIGLAAAIPAVVGYNYLVRKVRVLESEMDSFSHDYLNIVRRYFLPA